MTCPDFDQLLAWRDASQSSDSAEVQAHLADDCPDCARRLELLEAMDQGLVAAHAEPSAALQQLTLRALADAGGPRTSPTRPSDGRARRTLIEWLGALVDEATPRPLALGLRGDDDPRPRRYEAGPVVLEVGLVDGEALLGQLMDVDPEQPVVHTLIGASVTLFTGRRVLSDTVDSLGGFHFAHGPAASCLLCVESGERRLVFPDIDLRTDGA